MKKSVFFLLFVSCFGFGQDNTWKMRYSLDLTKILLPTLQNVGSMNGLPITGITTNYVHYPRITAGFSRKIHEKMAFGLELGFGNSATSVWQNENKEYSLWEFRPELQYELNNEGKVDSYIGFEFFFVQNQDTYTRGFYRREKYGLIRYDKAKFLRQKVGGMFTLGVYQSLFKSFGLEYYAGIGVQFTQIAYSDIENGQLIDFEFKHGYKNFRDQGSSISPEFTMGIKMFFSSNNS